MVQIKKIFCLILFVEIISCQEWTYQDAFCYKENNQNDLRYWIKSFAIFKDYLFIFTPDTFFVTQLKSPPFFVSRGLSYSDLNGQISNLDYGTSLINSILYTTVGIEVDDSIMLLLIGAVVSFHFYHSHNPIHFHQHQDDDVTMPIFWNIKDPYVSPSLDFDVSAVLSDGKNYFDEKSNTSTTRFISGKGYFFLLVMTEKQEVTITRYDVQPNLKFQLTKYVLYKIDGDSFMLEPASKENLNEQSNLYKFVRNGFIFGSKMYLTEQAHTEEYNLTYLSETQIEIHFDVALINKDMIKCRLFDEENVAFHFTIYLAIYCALFVVILSFMASSNPRTGHKFICGPNTILKELPANFFYR